MHKGESLLLLITSSISYLIYSLIAGFVISVVCSVSIEIEIEEIKLKEGNCVGLSSAGADGCRQKSG